GRTQRAQRIGTRVDLALGADAIAAARERNVHLGPAELEAEAALFASFRELGRPGARPGATAAAVGINPGQAYRGLALGAPGALEARVKPAQPVGAGGIAEEFARDQLATIGAAVQAIHVVDRVGERLEGRKQPLMARCGGERRGASQRERAGAED